MYKIQHVLKAMNWECQGRKFKARCGIGQCNTMRKAELGFLV